MSDEKLLSTLSDLGLSDKEARVYYSALTIGPSTVKQIAGHSGVKRTTVYSVLDDLKARSLMRKDIFGFKELWVAESPEALQSLLASQQKRFDSILPQLLALHKLEGEESVIKYYEGLEAVKAVYSDNLERVKIGEEYMVLSDGEIWSRLDPDYFMDFIQRRGKLNINVRMILTDSPWARERKAARREANEKTRLLPPGVMLNTNLVIIPSRVFIHQMVEPIMGMVIENSNIINMHSEMFELIWLGLQD